MSAIPCFLKKKIIKMFENEESLREIAKMCDFEQNTVNQLKHNLKDVDKKSPSSGRKEVLTLEDKIEIIRSIASCEATSAKDATDIFVERTGKRVSQWTVRRMLKKSGFHGIVKYEV